MTGAGTILVVDDEPDVVEMLQEFFLARGYRVDVATNGGDAVMLASLSRPDAVVLDIRLPDTSGADILDALHAIDASIAVVMLSGCDDEALARATLKAGAFDYVRKPFDFPHLEQAVSLAVTVGREKARPGVVVPLRDRRGATAAPAPETAPRCEVCQAPVTEDDTSAVIERGVLSHGPCWLAGRAPAP